MRKTTVHDDISVASGETDIYLSAGNGRMFLEINYPGGRMPVKTYRRAMAYRKFLKLADMPVYIFVNNEKIIRMKGRRLWVYKPFRLMGWMIKNLLSS